MNLIALPLLDVATSPVLIGLTELIFIVPVVAAIVTVVVHIIRYINKKKNAKAQPNTKNETP